MPGNDLKRAVQIAPEHFRPWHRADQLHDASLFWLPVSAFPPRAAEKHWLSIFFQSLGNELQKKFELRGEHFLQLKVIYPGLSDAFFATMQRLLPYQGLARRPGYPVVAPLTPKEIDLMMKGGPVPHFDELSPDLCFWFVKPDVNTIHQHFLGTGGYTQIWLPPSTVQPSVPAPINKKVREHPAFKDIDIDGTIRATYALADPFQKTSKELFGADLAKNQSVAGFPFILPLLNSADVFAAPGDLRRQWLDFMPVYANESKEDAGLIFFAERGVDPIMVDVLADLRAKALAYSAS